MTATATRCLNCGAELHGAFCAACGQRSVPVNPTVAQLTGDAWEEMTGYDGRIASTFRALLHPGRLTHEYLQGRRARYLPPVRLYLTVSVLYFVVAAGAPQIATPSDGEATGPGGLRIELTDQVMTDEERAEALRQIDRAPWVLRPLLRSAAEDPRALRARIFAIMPRIFFGLLPVFAGIVALFYRGYTFPAALVFAAHLHAVAFLIFTVSEAAKYTGRPWVSAAIGLAAAIGFAAYALRAFRAVFGGSWPATLAKASAVGLTYLFAAIPAFVIMLAWAALT
jgi:hypothetical protein